MREGMLQQPLQEIARDILAAVSRGLLKVNPVVQGQLEQVAETGAVQRKTGGERVEPSRQLLIAIRDLAWSQQSDDSSSVPTHTMTIVSLVRFKEGMHRRGRAVDIPRFAGKRLHVLNPDDALAGAIELIKSLPPGYYALGLPRPPQRTMHDLKKYPYFFEPISHDPPFLKQEYCDRQGEFNGRNVFLAGHLPPNSSPGRGKLRRDLQFFVDPAAREAFADAVKAAAENDAVILYVFPDAPDHIHLCVGSTPDEMNRC